MFTARSTMIATVLALAVGVSVSLLQAAAPAGAPATAPALAKVGSVSGKAVDKDGKPAAAAQVRYAPVTATAPAGGAPARGGRGMGNATTDDKGAFTITAVPVGQINITVTLTAADGTRQRGTTAAPVDVKDGAETKLTADIKLADMPARGGAGGAGGMGGMPMTAPATTTRPAGM